MFWWKLMRQVVVGTVLWNTIISINHYILNFYSSINNHKFDPSVSGLVILFSRSMKKVTPSSWNYPILDFKELNSGKDKNDWWAYSFLLTFLFIHFYIFAPMRIRIMQKNNHNSNVTQEGLPMKFSHISIIINKQCSNLDQHLMPHFVCVVPLSHLYVQCFLWLMILAIFHQIVINLTIKKSEGRWLFVFTT